MEDCTTFDVLVDRRSRSSVECNDRDVDMYGVIAASKAIDEWW